MRRGARVSSVIGATLLGASVLGVAAGSTPKSIPDVQQLYRSATLHVRHADRGQLAKAVLYEADGLTSRGRGVSTAAGITRWHFVFENSTPGSPYRYATTDYGPSPRGYGRVSAFRSTFLEDYEITRAPKVSLGRAVALLHRAGHRGTFTSVTLRDPIGPPFEGPRYLFDFPQAGGDAYISVNATSGRVSTLTSGS